MYEISLALLGLGFAATFFLQLVLPPLWASGDVIAVFAGGLVNPYAAGYALDAIFCWWVLAAWVIDEAKKPGHSPRLACPCAGRDAGCRHQPSAVSVATDAS